MDAKLRCSCLGVALIAILVLKTRLHHTFSTLKSPVPELVATVPLPLSSQLARVRRVSLRELQKQMQRTHDRVTDRASRDKAHEGKPIPTALNDDDKPLNLPTPTEVFRWMARTRTGPLLVTHSPVRDWPAMQLWYNETDDEDPYKYISQRVQGNFTV